MEFFYGKKSHKWILQTTNARCKFQTFVTQCVEKTENAPIGNMRT